MSRNYDLIEPWRSTYDAWKTDAPDPGSLADADDAKARDWQDATSEVLAFAKKYGLGATLRMVGAALENQGELFK